MPTTRLRTALASALALAALALLMAARPADGAAWRAPVDGAIVARFAVGSDPFARGQRRGVDFAARAGTAVTAPCGGRVSFAGDLPRHAGTVAIRCGGGLTATVLGLALPLHVGAGTTVVPGSRVGTAGSAGRIRLGARRTAQRFGYVDPEALLRTNAAPPPALPHSGRRPSRGPGSGTRRGPGSGPVAEPAPTAHRRPAIPAMRRRSTAVDPGTRAAAAHRPRSSAAPTSPPRVPPAAWAGLALVAVSLPTGALVARRRRASPPRAAERVHAAG